MRQDKHLLPTHLLAVLLLLLFSLLYLLSEAPPTLAVVDVSDDQDDEEDAHLRTPCKFPAIYNFGDSNSDTGGLSAAFFRIMEPNGQTFFGKAVGRASDGRLMIDFFAEHLGLPYLSAYLNSVGANFHRGVNFATASSTIRRPNQTIFQGAGRSPFSLDVQVEQFIQFKSRVIDPDIEPSARLPKPETFQKALYMIDIGQNDIADELAKMNHEAAIEAIPNMINLIATAINTLHFQGARAFWVHNTGPVGCLPHTLTYVPNPPWPNFLDEYGCIKNQNEVANEFNKQLKAKIISLRQELQDTVLTYVDIYAAKYGLIGDAKNQGFNAPADICCGYYEGDIRVQCSESVPVNGSLIYGRSCADPSKAISWDGVHYTDAANQWLASRILNGSFSDPPMPITQACYNQQKV